MQAPELGAEGLLPKSSGAASRAPGLESRGSVWGNSGGFEPLVGNFRQSSYGAGPFLVPPLEGRARAWRLFVWETDPQAPGPGIIYS
jgi:hypothetical protein